MSEHKLGQRGAVWLATGVGIGLVSPAPGTIGGLWGLPLVWALAHLDPVVEKTAIVALVFAAVAICAVAARALGESKDPQSIVLDEIVALPIVFWSVPQRSLGACLTGYLLFRVFDIIKPAPVRQLERLPGGLGIVADDCMAAIYACLALRGIVWLFSLNWLVAA